MARLLWTSAVICEDVGVELKCHTMGTLPCLAGRGTEMSERRRKRTREGRRGTWKGRAHETSWVWDNWVTFQNVGVLKSYNFFLHVSFSSQLIHQQKLYYAYKYFGWIYIFLICCLLYLCMPVCVYVFLKEVLISVVRFWGGLWVSHTTALEGLSQIPRSHGPTGRLARFVFPCEYIAKLISSQDWGQRTTHLTLHESLRIWGWLSEGWDGCAAVSLAARGCRRPGEAVWSSHHTVRVLC